MPSRRWIPAAAFGTLNAGLFLVGLSGLGVHIDAAWLGILLWLLSIVAAYWSLAAADDLTRITGKDGAAILVRGSVAGALAGAALAAAAWLPAPLEALYAAMGAAFIGLFVGLGCALADVIVLGAVRLLSRARQSA